MHIPGKSLYVNQETLCKINSIGYYFGFLDGINHQVAQADKNNNQIATIHAIALGKLPNIQIEQIEDVYFNRNSGYIAKELSTIRSIVDAYRYIADANKTCETAFQVFLTVNKILNTETTPYTNIGYNSMQSWQVDELKSIFDATIDPYLSVQITNRYILAAEIFHSYYGENRFTDFFPHSWLFVALYIIFRMDTLLPDLPLKGLITTMMEKKTDSLHSFVNSVLDQIYVPVYELRYELLAKRNATKPEIITRQTRRLLAVMTGDKPMSSRQLMIKFKFKDLSSFRKRYLAPAVKSGLVERSLPDHLSSPRQTYFLTAKGREYMDSTDIRSDQRPVHKKA